MEPSINLFPDIDDLILSPTNIQPALGVVELQPQATLLLEYNLTNAVSVDLMSGLHGLLKQITFNIDLTDVDLNTTDVIVQLQTFADITQIGDDFLSFALLGTNPSMNLSRTKLLIDLQAPASGVPYLESALSLINYIISSFTMERYLFITRKSVPKMDEWSISIQNDLLKHLPLRQVPVPLPALAPVVLPAVPQLLMSNFLPDVFADDENIVPVQIIPVPREEVVQQGTLLSCVEKCFSEYGVAMPSVIRDGLIGPPSAAMSVALQINGMNQERIEGDVPLPVGNAIAVDELPPNVGATAGHVRCMTTLSKQDTAVTKAIIALHRSGKDFVTSGDIVAYLRSHNLVKSYYAAEKSRKIPEEFKHLPDDYFIIKSLHKHVPPPENMDLQEQWEGRQVALIKEDLRALTKAVARALVSIQKKRCASSQGKKSGKYRYSAEQ